MDVKNITINYIKTEKKISLHLMLIMHQLRMSMIYNFHFIIGRFKHQ